MTTRMAELAAERVPFVHVTVVRAQVPTSARPGDDAIVHPDGSMEGFIGGHCAQGSVRAAALDALRDGQTVLLRVLPDDAEGFPESPGAQVVVNPCLSGGALELFIEPVLPPPLLHLVGTTPIADAVQQLAEPLGFVVRRADPADPPDGAVAAVISSLGNDEEQAIRVALDAGTRLVGLVASTKRGAAVLSGLGLTEEERSRMRTPVGLDIGARTPEEIALAIMAEIVRAMRREGLRAPEPGAATAPRQVVDPVCGMTVVVGPQTPHLVVDGQDFWFCGSGCRTAYASSAGHG